ncbi:PTS sugar transporter subunit IIB [Agreia sp. COWG]|uniref:PTS sugar transporter subunit IIB n=1 Tax=Agreia sp. COWG TaxID=2773266 RepID=UPI0019263987|nr:PTS sugar transporter [Agreia sp. COWG]CAD6004453.1 PTS system, cellobiose-specific IIB component [Agreia sp. COWG]
MHRVLVVCGAGASSTFLAHRIRTAARNRDIDAIVSASGTTGLQQRLFTVDVLLVGPHLAGQFSALHSLAATAGVSSALLPADVFDRGGEDVALDLVLSLTSP